MTDEIASNRRILLVDDHRPIHEDFREILGNTESKSTELDELESAFFGDHTSSGEVLPSYKLSSAFQGQEALSRVKRSLQQEEPFALIFMDVRMPPGWDGIETIRRISEIDSDAQFVICTAFADYTWQELYNLFGDNDRIVFIRKPFDQTEVRQLASTLTKKWQLQKQAALKMVELEELVSERTAHLNKSLAELQEAHDKMETLQGLIPVCAHCKQVRNDDGYWEHLDKFIDTHTNATISHGICPDCLKKHYSRYAGGVQERAAE